MKRDEKREWAKLVYINEGLTQNETAKKCGVSLKSVNQWVNKYKWDELRQRFIITREQNLKRFYAQVDELNKVIESRPEGKRYSKNAEADTLVKLTAAIKNLELETSVAEIISVFMSFTNYMRTRNLELAQSVIPIMDDYVKSKIK